MTLDSDGNLYLCEEGFLVYNAPGTLIETIEIEHPTNVCFGGRDGNTLFITNRDAAYALEMNVSGIVYPSDMEDASDPQEPSEPQKDHCLVFDENLNFEVACATFNGTTYAFGLFFTPKASGLFWKLNESSIVNISASEECLSLNNELSLSIDCIKLDSRQYGFTMNFYPDLSGFLWQLDEASLIVNDPLPTM